MMTAGPNDTDATLTARVCTQLGAKLFTDFTLIGRETSRLTLPSCVVNHPSLVSVTLRRLIVNSFDSLPTSLVTLKMEWCYPAAASGSTSSTDGYNGDGSINWSEIWGRFSQLTSLTITNSQMTGNLDALPARVRTFDVSNNKLGGAGLSSLLNNVASNDPSPLVINLSDNNLNSVINEGFFNRFASVTVKPSSFSFYAFNSSLSGVLPLRFLDNFAGAQFNTFWLDLRWNKLTGSLPQPFLPTGLLNAASDAQPIFVLRLASNNFIGDLPGFSTITRVQLFLFDASNCRFDGKLPATMFPAGLISAYTIFSQFNLDLSNNRIHGSIPETFLALQTVSVYFDSVTVSLAGNDITGTIPENLFWKKYIPPHRRQADLPDLSDRSSSNSQQDVELHWQGGRFFNFYVQSNRLSGSLPPRLFSYNGARQVILFATNNALTGSIPSDYFNLFNNSLQFLLYAENNRLSGLPSSCSNKTYFDIKFANNQLHGSIPTAWQNCKWESINIKQNPGISGFIPPGLLTGSNLMTFEASNTLLTGTLPTLGMLRTLNLANTLISFCSNATFAAPPFLACDFSQSDACLCPLRFSICTLNCAPASKVVTHVRVDARSQNRPSYDLAYVVCSVFVAAVLVFALMATFWPALRKNLNTYHPLTPASADLPCSTHGAELL